MGFPTVPIPGRRGAWNTCCKGGRYAPAAVEESRVRSCQEPHTRTDRQTDRQISQSHSALHHHILN